MCEPDLASVRSTSMTRPRVHRTLLSSLIAENCGFLRSFFLCLLKAMLHGSIHMSYSPPAVRIETLRLDSLQP